MYTAPVNLSCANAARKRTVAFLLRRAARAREFRRRAANPKLDFCTNAGLHIDSGTRRFDSKALVALRHDLSLSEGSELVELGFNAIAYNAYSNGLAERQQHARGMRGALNGVAIPPVFSA